MKKIIALCLLAIFSCLFYVTYQTQRTHSFEECAAQLMGLVVTHPSPDIRNGMFGLINSGVVGVEFDDRLVPEFSNAIVFLDSQGNPGFIIKGSYLFAFRLDNHSQQVTLAHEYRHIRQILEGRFLFKYQNERRIESLTLPEIKRFGKEQFLAELEGYAAGCDFLMQLGRNNDGCELYDKNNLQPFKYDLAQFLTERLRGIRRPEVIALKEGYNEAAQEQ